LFTLLRVRVLAYFRTGRVRTRLHESVARPDRAPCDTARGDRPRLGFVHSGLDISAMIEPIWFVVRLDHGLARATMFVMAALLALAMAAVVNARRARSPQPA